jgi:hypothetical protein
MRRSILVSILLMLFCFTSHPVFAKDDIEDLLYSGIAEKRKTEAGTIELLHESEAKLKENPSDYPMNWMHAALCYIYAEFYLTDPGQQKDYFTLCKHYGEKATLLNPSGTAGHYWLGVGMAKWAEANGILYSLFTADDIVYEMNIVISLDPTFFKGLPYAIRASVYAFAPAFISVGDWDKARTDIASALVYGKDYRPVYKAIADIYAYWKEWDNAKAMIDEGLKLPFDQRLELEENDTIKKLNILKKKVDEELKKINH